MLESVHDHLSPAADGVHSRRAPGRNVLACCPPHFASVLDTERRDERPLEHVALHQHFVLVDDGRAGELPLRVRDHEERRVEHSQVLLPQQRAIEIEAVEPLRSEERHEVAPVGGQRGVRVRGLGMALDLRHAGVDRLLPEHPARGRVECVDDPPVDARVVHGTDVAVQPDLELRLLGAADGRAHEQAAAPDHRARVAEAGDGRLPADIPRRRHAPLGRKREALGDAGGTCPSERRPVSFGGRRLAGRVDHESRSQEHAERRAGSNRGIHAGPPLPR